MILNHDKQTIFEELLKNYFASTHSHEALQMTSQFLYGCIRNRILTYYIVGDKQKKYV